MKPLVFYCRWHEAKLRLRGRDATAVWGQLVFTDDQGTERLQDFHFDLKSWQLTLDEANGKCVWQLDEKGVVIT